jgi:hypothetical protein
MRAFTFLSYRSVPARHLVEHIEHVAEYVVWNLQRQNEKAHDDDVGGEMGCRLRLWGELQDVCTDATAKEDSETRQRQRFYHILVGD